MMLKRGYLFFIPLIIFVLFTNVIEVHAMNTGFSTTELSIEDKNIFMSNIGISVITKEPVKNGILCYDVNRNGMIAIGQNGANGKEVCIYSPDGNFLYGYMFNCTQSFAVEWGEKHINIYFVRSDVVISLDPQGNILDLQKVENTTNNNTYRNNLIYTTSRVADNTTYQVRNNMGILNWFALSYSQLIAVDSNGAERIVYDVGPSNTVSLAVVIVLILGVIIIGFISFLGGYHKKLNMKL